MGTGDLGPPPKQPEQTTLYNVNVPAGSYYRAALHPAGLNNAPC